MVLGSIVHLQDPLSAGNLEDLPGADSDHINVRTSLMRLHSVVLVPEDDGHIIRLLHSSFFDLLTDNTRCRNPRLVLNPHVRRRSAYENTRRTFKPGPFGCFLPWWRMHCIGILWQNYSTVGCSQRCTFEHSWKSFKQNHVSCFLPWWHTNCIGSLW